MALENMQSGMINFQWQRSTHCEQHFGVPTEMHNFSIAIGMEEYLETCLNVHNRIIT